MKYMIIIFSTTYLFLWNDLRKTFGRGGVEARWRGAGCGLWGNLEGTLGMGKEQVGSVSSKHSTTDSVLFDPLHARACVRACVPEPCTDDHAARGLEGFRGAFLRGDRRFARRVVSRIQARGVHVSGKPVGRKDGLK